MKESRNQKRARLINYIYSFELFDKPVDSNEAFESGDFSKNEIKIIDNISKNYDKFKIKIVSNLSSGWSWERIAPYLRSVLIYGSFEFLIHDKNLVINELVLLTQGYAPGDSYKFVNGILNTLGDYYEKVKSN